MLAKQELLLLEPLCQPQGSVFMRRGNLDIGMDRVKNEVKTTGEKIVICKQRGELL
jgi:hypothetical protein